MTNQAEIAERKAEATQEITNTIFDALEEKNLTQFAAVAVVTEVLINLMDRIDIDKVRDYVRLQDWTDVARFQSELRKPLDEADKAKKTMQKLYDWVRTGALPDKMEAAGIDSATVAGVGRVTLSASLMASIKADCKSEAYQYLQDNGHGDIITTTVNASTLKALAKKKIEDNDALPAEFFNVTTVTQATIYKK